MFLLAKVATTWMNQKDDRTACNQVYALRWLNRLFANQRKHQNSAWLAFVWGINQGLMNSPHKWPVMWKMFPFDDVIMDYHQPSKSATISLALAVLRNGIWYRVILTLRPVYNYWTQSWVGGAGMNTKSHMISKGFVGSQWFLICFCW